MHRASNGSSGESENWVCLGTVAKPFGVRGGVRIRLHNPDSQSLKPGLMIELRTAKDQGKISLKIKSEHGNGRVLFEEITDRNEAERLRGQEVWIQRDDLPQLSPDETYLVDFLGAQVHSEKSGLLGEIIHIDIHSPQPLARVKTLSGQVIEMPFVAGLIVGLSEADKEVWIEEPIGLFSGEPDVAEEGGS
ncbi:MAG: 16S rRNA processing protein RimM [Myxococcales bacterium]|nr:16S rRNA processing protein RimM [Myxococcales bacterium]